VVIKPSDPTPVPRAYNGKKGKRRRLVSQHSADENPSRGLASKILQSLMTNAVASVTRPPLLHVNRANSTA
jgi:hypothetical protein